MRIKNKYMEALKENVNVAGLGLMAAASAALLNPLPLLAGLVAEAAYLIFIPDSKWYEARLSRRYDAEVERRRQKLKEEILPMLRPETRARFDRLEAARRLIDSQQSDGRTWFREVLRKLDYLLERFLVFANKEVQFRSYLQSILQEFRDDDPRATRRLDQRASTGKSRSQRPDLLPVDRPSQPGDAGRDKDEEWVRNTVAEIQSYYDREVASVLESKKRETDESTLAVLGKRLEVLERRKEIVGKIEKILLNLNHQLQLVEDTIGLINDEIRARSPEQVLSDIDEVIVQADTLSKVLEEVAPYEQMIAGMQRTSA